eukprot:TRINITY_DN2214_c0_g1_i1.p2 TRINITY_DN2214_c0_g1~~TRINITY_DN2214_c0_g1_i1.p2  ORF type:complete len:238 (-),score=68.10 TRINITY_DN2214_c0_g1_i1:230-943(-)
MQAQYLEQLVQHQVSVGQKEKANLDRLEKELAYQESAIEALSKIALASAGAKESSLSTQTTDQNAEGAQGVMPAAQDLSSAPQTLQDADMEDVPEANSAPLAALLKSIVPKQRTAGRVSWDDQVVMPQEPAAQYSLSAPQAIMEDVAEATPAPVAALQRSMVPQKQTAGMVSWDDQVVMPQEPAAQYSLSAPQAIMEDVAEATPAPVAALQRSVVPQKPTAGMVSWRDLMSLRWCIR